MTYRHKDPNWQESIDWRRERSARVWQALQCWAEIVRLGTQPLECSMRDDVPVVVGREEWPSFADYRLTLLRRARAARVWQALQCFSLLCCLDRDVTNRYLHKANQLDLTQQALNTTRRRALAGQAWQAIQCWLLMCCCQEDAGYDFVRTMERLAARLRRPSP